MLARLGSRGRHSSRKARTSHEKVHDMLDAKHDSNCTKCYIHQQRNERPVDESGLPPRLRVAFVELERARRVESSMLRVDATGRRGRRRGRVQSVRGHSNDLLGAVFCSRWRRRRRVVGGVCARVVRVDLFKSSDSAGAAKTYRVAMLPAFVVLPDAPLTGLDVVLVLARRTICSRRARTVVRSRPPSRTVGIVVDVVLELKTRLGGVNVVAALEFGHILVPQFLRREFGLILGRRVASASL
eukprot:6208451-Pleurochrysis_carterae.AAC.1